MKTSTAVLVLVMLFAAPFARGDAPSAAGGFATRFMGEVEQLKALEREARGRRGDARNCECYASGLVRVLRRLEDQRGRIDGELGRLRERAQRQWREIFEQVARQAQTEPSLVQVGGKALTSILLAAAFDAVDNAAGRMAGMRAASGAGRAARAAAAKALEKGAEKAVERAAGKTVKKAAAKVMGEVAGHPVAIADTLKKIAGREAAAAITGRYPQLAELDATYLHMGYWTTLALRNRAVQQGVWERMRQGACGGCALAEVDRQTLLKGEASSQAYDAWHYANQLIMDESLLSAADYYGREEAYRCALLRELRKLARLRELAEDGMREAARGVALHRRTILQLHALAERQFAHEPRYLEKKLGWWGYTLATFAVSMTVPVASGTAVAVGEAISDMGDLLLKKGVSREMRQRIREVRVFISDLTALQEDWGKALRTVPRAERKVAAKLAELDKGKSCPEPAGETRIPPVAGCWISLNPSISRKEDALESYAAGFLFDDWHLHKEEIRKGYRTVLEITPGPGNALRAVMRLPESEARVRWSGHYDAELNLAEFYLEDPETYLRVRLHRDEEEVRDLIDSGFDMVLRLTLRPGDWQRGTLDVIAGLSTSWGYHTMQLDQSGRALFRMPPLQVRSLKPVGIDRGTPLREIEEGTPFRFRAVVSQPQCPMGWGSTLARARVLDEYGENWSGVSPVFALLRPSGDDPTVLLSEPVTIEATSGWGTPDKPARVALEYNDLGKAHEEHWGHQRLEMPFRWKRRETTRFGPGMLMMPAFPQPPLLPVPGEETEHGVMRVVRMLEANSVHPARFLRVTEKHYASYLDLWKRDLRGYDEHLIPEQRKRVEEYCNYTPTLAPLDALAQSHCEQERRELEKLKRERALQVQGLAALSARFRAMPEDLVELAFAPPEQAGEAWREKYAADLALAEKWSAKLRREGMVGDSSRADMIQALRRGIVFATGVSLE